MLTATKKVAARIRVACTSKTASRGHTLIELVMVGALMTGGSSIAYPQLASIADDYRVRNASRRVVIELQKARLRAISEGTCVRVAFDPTQKTYQIQKGESATCTTSSSFPTEETARSVDSANRITITGAGNPIFTPRGISLTNSITTLSGRRGSITVKVDLTGRVYAS